MAKAFTNWEDRIGRHFTLWDLNVLHKCISVGSISKAADADALVEHVQVPQREVAADAIFPVRERLRHRTCQKTGYPGPET